MNKRIRAVAGCLALSTIIFCASSSRAQNDQAGNSKSVRQALHQQLPSLDGSKLAVDLVEVTYGPGASSAAHTHPCPVIGYVVDGAVRMQVQGQAERTYQAGESFYEAPNGVHAISANASKTAPAKFLAFFVCDRTTPLSIPVKEQGR